MKPIFLSLLLGVFLFSCEKDLTVDFPFEGERFLIYSEFENGEIFRVKVDKTYPPTGEILFEKTFLDNVEVDIYEDGVFLENLSHAGPSSHLFYSKNNNRARLGHSYQVKAKSIQIPEVSSAPETLLPAVEIDSIWLTEGTYFSPLNPSIKAYLVNVSINNIPENVPYLFFETIGLTGNILTGAQFISFDDLGQLETPCTFGGGLSRFFKTSCFDTKNTVFQFYTEAVGGTQSPPYMNAEIDIIEFKVSSVNKSYFDFTYLKNDRLDFFSIFEGVNPTYSTFDKGYGAILTKNTVSKSLRVK
ncbi:DUF4249 family protein [Jiulongibacter sediminis]|uniref:DUF4249 family protein n=1 Tax=Jiulongibacter sediminis TaxID=1605367 RepID=UPI0026ED566A|nr:DUF4249 family protein [Jiulongibacter sediminis]